MEIFVTEAAAEAGLTYSDMVITLICLILLLLLLFGFVFLAMAAWSNETDFMTVIRSFIVTLMGAIVSFVRPSRQIDDEETQLKIKQRIDEFKTDDQGDY